MRHVLVALTVGLGLVLGGCAAEESVKTGAGKAAAGKLAVRVNCAGGEYVDQNGVKWQADQVLEGAATWGALGGVTITRTGLTVAGTKSPDLYLTERYSMKGYQFAVPAGKYAVRLHFAETFEGIKAEGQRVFSVKINGQPKLADFDVFKTAGGFAKPLIMEFKGVQAADGKITIEFEPKTQNPEINGIEILAQ